MKATVTATLFIAASLSVAIATAEVSVRHPTTSENEFQAVSQALGYTPVSEILAEKNPTSAETSELFQIRQFEAQAEWLRGGGETTAMDRLLALFPSADWPSSERQVLATFFLRKIDLTAATGNLEKLDSVFAALNAFLAHDENLDLGEMRPEIKVRWAKFAADDKKKWVIFPASPPSDVTAIFVNGRIVPRYELLTFAFPRRPVRVTFISNAYQPTTVILNGGETDWPILHRQVWVNDDCSLMPTDKKYGDSPMKVLGFAPCDSSQPKSDAGAKKFEIKDQKTIEDFGLSPRSSNPIEMPPAQGPSIVKNPWFWGVLGAVAIGAVVAMQATGRESRATVQPANHDAW